MKNKPHYLTILTVCLLLFSVGYLVTRLIIKGLYIDAIFALAVPVLFGLMVYFIRKGK